LILNESEYRLQILALGTGEEMNAFTDLNENKRDKGMRQADKRQHHSERSKPLKKCQMIIYYFNCSILSTPVMVPSRQVL